MDGKRDIAALVLRIVVGLVFIPHGYTKVFGSGGAAAFAADMPGFGIPTFLGYVAAYAEFFGAILLIAGLLTRLDALLLAGMMFVAAFVVQLRDALYALPPGASKFFEAMRAIELPLTLFAASVALVFLGGGKWSLDRALRLEERMRALLPKKAVAAQAV